MVMKDRQPRPAETVPLTFRVGTRMAEVLAAEGRKCGLAPAELARRLFEAAYAARLGPVGDAALERAVQGIDTSGNSPEGASEKVGGVAGACSALAAASEIAERREPDADVSGGVTAGREPAPFSELPADGSGRGSAAVGSMKTGSASPAAPVASAVPSLGVSSLDLKAASSAPVASAEGAATFPGGVAALPAAQDVKTARAFLAVRMGAGEIARACGWTLPYARACVAAARGR